MDEQTWLTSAGPWEMFLFLRSKPYERKRRLFACACCRLLWPWMQDERSRNAVKTVEEFTDRKATRNELHAVFKEAWSAADWNNPLDAARAAVAASAVEWAYVAGGASITHKAVEIAQAPFTTRKKRLEVEKTQVMLMRDIFGNPFQVVLLMASWLDWHNGLVRIMAQNAYENRILPRGTLDSTLLSDLAGVLEAAGCTDQMITDHLRSPGPHVRGCWVLDLILGKQNY